MCPLLPSLAHLAGPPPPRGFICPGVLALFHFLLCPRSAPPGGSHPRLEVTLTACYLHTGGLPPASQAQLVLRGPCTFPVSLPCLLVSLLVSRVVIYQSNMLTPSKCPSLLSCLCSTHSVFHKMVPSLIISFNRPPLSAFWVSTA